MAENACQYQVLKRHWTGTQIYVWVDKPGCPCSSQNSTRTTGLANNAKRLQELNKTQEAQENEMGKYLSNTSVDSSVTSTTDSIAKPDEDLDSYKFGGYY